MLHTQKQPSKKPVKYGFLALLTTIRAKNFSDSRFWGDHMQYVVAPFFYTCAAQNKQAELMVVMKKAG
jgi:hypothetical protein